MSSDTTTKLIILKLKFLFSQFGLPETIVADNDTKNSSKESIDFCKSNVITYVTSPNYHPCSNGRAENSVRTCKKLIKTILGTYSCKYIIKAKILEDLFEYRNTTHRATGLTPARLLMAIRNGRRSA